jgi:hypothetical protein
MAWDDTPPSKDELAKAPAASWDAAPPTEDEIKASGMQVVDWKGKGEAALQGFGQAATLGYLPQLQAGAEKIRSAIDTGAAKLGIGPETPEMNEERLRKQGFKISGPDNSYVAQRDAAIKRDQALKEEHPGSYLAGQVGGIVATAPAIGGGLTKLPGMAKTAASFGGRVLQGAAGGAAQGALQNPGDTEGEIDPLQIEERKSNAKTGAMLGAVAQVGTEAIKNGADLVTSMPGRMKDWAALKSFKSAGGVKKHWEAAERGVGAEEIGKEMLKQGVVKPGATYEDIAKSAGDLKQKAGRVIGDTYEEATKIVSDPNFQAALSPQHQTLLAQTELNATKIADDLEQSLTAQLTGKAGGSKALAGVKSVLDELRQNGQNVSIEKLQEFKSGVDDLIRYNKDLADLPVAKQYMKVVRDELKSRMESRLGALDKILGSERVGSLKEANRQYGIWANAESAARDRVMRENANRFLSPSDYFTGGLGMAAGFASGDSLESRVKNAAIGGTAALANKGMRLYGNPVVAKAALGAGELMSRIPQQIPGAVTKVAGAMARNPGVLGAGAKSVLGGPKMSAPEAPAEDAPKLIDAPQTPPDKFAARGLERLGITDHALTQALLGDEKGRQLLREASQFSPGSQGFKRIKEQIKRQWVDSTRAPATRQGKGTK